ncbi:FAD-dependent oxidoreductase [Ectopseudomonas guguanensis]|uniref:Pyruvate/2-oxoglutarate dehydrogenase complex, dihydrolipoamide dehydrogenase (E3) component n=3 Tax=cellular organisms TaxID=131567 RepID=A0A1H0VSZ3_9GAMM|nr:FAD-dependent oxidoreductase [Pseudomonas guguanensis]SDP81361.1 Pyruvate/2-oxoglutarate dehydrogenase complex, dihydrolipoamide dehydrogenase (E3) component [Pseudomonas guguanensis]
MKASRWIILALLVTAVACFFIFDLGEYLTLESIKSHSGALKAKVQDHPWWAAGVFFAIYAALTALSFPGTVVLTLLAGALFGLIEGTLLVSFASNVGALVAMLISRFMLRDWVQKRFGKQIAGINKGLTRDGTFYLVSLRLIPIVPFVLLNPALGLTRINMWTFWWTTQLGMLPGHAIYVNAGEKLVTLRSVSDILSPSIISTLVLLAVFPIIATRLLAYYKARKVYSGWSKPKRFDYNLVVIGGGSGGLATARIAASYKARVCLVERERLGGVAMHEGGVPTKALRRLVNELHVRRDRQPPAEEFAELMTQVRQLTESARHDTLSEDCSRLGVEVVEGEGRLSSPWTVEVEGRTLTTRAVIIATGSRPWLPPISGLDDIEPLTCDTLLQLRERPDRLLVLGSGAGACEFAQLFQRLGSRVSLVSEDARLLEQEDADAGKLLAAALAADGVDIQLGLKAQRVESHAGERRLVCQGGENGVVSLPFDRLLLMTGNYADVEGLGLDELKLQCCDDVTLEVDEYLATCYPNIYAVGSVAGPCGAPHVAEHQAWYAAVNALFGGLKRFVVSERVLPRAVFTSPEIASVGLTEQKARELKLEYEVTRLDMATLPGAVVEGAKQGFVKVLTQQGEDRILGVTIVSAQASETLAGFVVAMKYKLGLRKLGDTVQLSPTQAQALRRVAEAWRQQHRSARLLAWAERLSRWRIKR